MLHPEQNQCPGPKNRKVRDRSARSVEPVRLATTQVEAATSLREAGRIVWPREAALGVADHVNSTASGQDALVSERLVRQSACSARDCADFRIQRVDHRQAPNQPPPANGAAYRFDQGPLRPKDNPDGGGERNNLDPEPKRSSRPKADSARENGGRGWD